MPVVLLYNLHNLHRWLKLYYAPKALLLFLWVLWLCKLIYHKLGWICCWMWNRNFDFGTHVNITALPEWQNDGTYNRCSQQAKCGYFSQLLVEDGRSFAIKHEKVCRVVLLTE